MSGAAASQDVFEAEGIRETPTFVYGPEHDALRKGLRPYPVPPPLPDAVARLEQLTRRVRHDLEILCYPKDDWVLPRRRREGDHVYDVVIVGAGQCGLAAALALARDHVTNVLVLDRAPKGGEGPWATYSRMWTLRSPKHVTGPDLGIPSLAPRSWFEAVFGEEGWDALDKWPRVAWQDYLNWYREALQLPVRNDTRVEAIDPDGDIVRLTCNGGSELVYGRKLVLATGIEGMGDWHIPSVVSENLPRTDWTLCTEDVDSLAWQDQRIAVVGAGATGWDRAADLLELGARSVDMYMRRRALPKSNPFRYLEKAGFLRHYASMADAEKWRWMHSIFSLGQTPTQDGVDRCCYFENFTIHPGAEWERVHRTASGIEVTATDGSVAEFDHLFIGAGFSMNPINRPELRPLAGHIATWADIYTPPAEYRSDWMASYPYLTADLRFVEKVPGSAPVLKNIYCFNYGATITNAHSGGSLSGIRYGIEPMIHGITYALWREDEPEHFRITRAWSQADTDPTPTFSHRWQPEKA
jgi:FAD-dependent urate hydroxylase